MAQSLGGRWVKDELAGAVSVYPILAFTFYDMLSVLVILVAVLGKIKFVV